MSTAAIPQTTTRRVLRKAKLADHIRCECGWEW